MKRTKTYYECNVCHLNSNEDDAEFHDQEKSLSKLNIHICDNCQEYDVVSLDTLSTEIKDSILKNNPKLSLGLFCGSKNSAETWVAVITPDFSEIEKTKFVVLNHK
jgi:hypothetical protein